MLSDSELRAIDTLRQGDIVDIDGLPVVGHDGVGRGVSNARASLLLRALREESRGEGAASEVA